MRVVSSICFVIVVSWLTVASAAAQSPVQKVHLVPADSLASLSWISLGADPKADGLHPRLPDAKGLFYAIEPKTDTVWLKVTLHEPPPERWFGINVAFDTDGDPDNGMAWWGTNKIKFDRLASAYLFKADDDWQGYVGMADSESVGRGNMTNLARTLKVGIDRNEQAIFVGVPRSALGAASTVRVIATVGSMVANNDDVPNEGMFTVKLKP